MNTKPGTETGKVDIMIDGIKGGRKIKKTETGDLFGAYSVYVVVMLIHECRQVLFHWSDVYSMRGLRPIRFARFKNTFHVQ